MAPRREESARGPAFRPAKKPRGTRPLCPEAHKDKIYLRSCSTYFLLLTHGFMRRIHRLVNGIDFLGHTLAICRFGVCAVSNHYPSPGPECRDDPDRGAVHKSRHRHHRVVIGFRLWYVRLLFGTRAAGLSTPISAIVAVINRPEGTRPQADPI